MTTHKGVVSPEVEASIRRDCQAAAREMLGQGYVPDYYANMAGEFVQIALSCWREGYREGYREGGVRRG